MEEIFTPFDKEKNKIYKNEKYTVNLLISKTNQKKEEIIKTVDKIDIEPDKNKIRKIKDLKYYIIDRYKKSEFCPCVLIVWTIIDGCYSCSEFNDNPEEKIEKCAIDKNIYIFIDHKKKCDCGFYYIQSLGIRQIYEFYNKKIKDLQKQLNLKDFEIESIKKNYEELNKDILINLEENFKEKSNTICKEDTKNQSSENQSQNIIILNQHDFDVKSENFYDVIIDINSIKDINNGWKIKMNKEGERRFNEYRKKESLIIGVIGNSNRGKSFLLSKISKINLPNGTSIRTEGLSIKYPDLEKYKHRNIILLDSAGLETPLLLDKQNIKNEDNLNELIRDKARDKIMTELFLQNFIINNSNILIAVVGILTYSEQKLLNRIREECSKTKKKLFLIHNLMTFSCIKQVEQYINDYLLKDATFDLGKRLPIHTKNENKKNVPFYYEKNKNISIIHLIFANEGSEAGKFYNDFALDYLETSYQEITDLKSFDCIQRLKERFKELSKELIEKNDKDLYFNDDDFLDNNTILKRKMLGLKTKREIILKKCFIDELGISNFRSNGFNPQYNYYKKGNKLIIRVETPGNLSIFPDIKYSGKLSIIEIKGEKNKDKEPLNFEDNLFNSRDFGKFYFEIPLLLNFANKSPEIKSRNGVCIIEYELYEENSKIYEFKLNPDDEI